ncbi:MAG: hypothetical protein CH6_1027 [Candidatus Kapaibacterium sp.]|nr:MAG: hypothetical protein CH6_1027 [Candidatus Kapabacteria bacterium]
MKPKVVYEFIGYTKGLEPTYKELKPGLQSNGLPPQKRLEPTYKELKQDLVFGIIILIL